MPKKKSGFKDDGTVRVLFGIRSQTEILERIKTERNRLRDHSGHIASITRGWIEALEWTINRDR